MGLKPSGLRGSLRNQSSVLPAFLEVEITNTNTPVQEGDILTVDYSADNTGDARGVQDIRLEIDSVEEDVDTDVMVSGGASTTGTLEWDTTGDSEAEYTATVLSDDDSDSVTVEIESAIPDIQLSRPDDDDSFDSDSEYGLRIETTVTWSEIDGRISSNTSGVETAEIIRVSDEGQIGQTDISDLSAGDAFRVDLDDDLVDGETYAFVVSGNGATLGLIDPVDYPITSDDDDLSIIEGAAPDLDTRAGQAIGIVEIGNLID